MPPRRIGLPAVVTVAVIALAVGTGGTIVEVRQALPPERAITDRPVQVEDEGYVSSRTCRSCHPSQYASWHRSYHRTMTQLATPETVRAAFSGVTVAGVQDHPIALTRRGRELWAEFDDPDWNGGS